MQERPTRLIVLVALLLAAALMQLGSVGTTQAATQRRAPQNIFMPAVMQRPPVSQDLTITHLGLYQTVQTAANSVSLVAHKPALLRVYAQAQGAATPPVAEVTVYAYQDTTFLGSLTIGPQAVPAQPSTAELSSTFNFDLPHDWLVGNVTLTASIDPVNTVLEVNESNNDRTAQFLFHDVAPLDLTIVPIHYHDTRTGRLFEEPAHDPISDWLLGAFPVSRINVTYHSPFYFAGDLRQPNEWRRLLSALSTLAAAEVGLDSTTVYYGLLPTAHTSGATWFEGGVSGLGWVGQQRVSVGLDLGVDTGHSAGHEIGHNFGRRHAPCGNPSSPDPHYPYPNATIGVYGMDTEDDVLLAPTANFDMMSYCGPEWVSDYTYEGLLQDQLARSALADEPDEGLLLQATLDGEEAVAMPVYRLSSAPLPQADSGYTAQLLDESGAVVATYPATLFEAEETGVLAQMLVAHVPVTETPIAEVRFLRQGEVVAKRQVATGGPDAGAQQVKVTAIAAGVKLSWGRPDVPALVRYSPDGERWTTLALDVLGGHLTLTDEQIPTAGQLQVIPGDGGPAMTVQVK